MKSFVFVALFLVPLTSYAETSLARRMVGTYQSSSHCKYTNTSYVSVTHEKTQEGHEVLEVRLKESSSSKGLIAETFELDKLELEQSKFINASWVRLVQIERKNYLKTWKRNCDWGNRNCGPWYQAFRVELEHADRIELAFPGIHGGIERCTARRID